MSSGLSGSCHTACRMAEEFPGKVFVADVHRVSVTQRHAIEDAKETFPDDELLYDPLTCSVSSHVEPNAFGMGVSVKITL